MENSQVPRERSEYRVALVDPPSYIKNPVFKDWVFPPGGLVAIASYLDAHGYAVKVLDANAMNADWNTIRRFFKEFQPDAVGVPAYTCVVYEAMYTLVLAREVCPGVVTFAGGTHFTFLPELSLRSLPELDFCIRGEGEETILELLDSLRTGKNSFEELSKIKGIAFLEKGRFIQTPDRPLIEDMDTLPMPSYHLFPVEKYNFPFFKESKERPEGMGVSFSRGCVNDCYHCGDTKMWRTTWRGRSGRLVADELEFLYERYGKKYFYIYDQNFFQSPERNLSFIAEMEKRKLPIIYWGQMRADTVIRDKELLGRYRKSGLLFALVGFEFMRDSQLERINKNITVSDSKKAAALLAAHDILIQGMTMIGDTEDTDLSIQRFVEFFTEEIPANWVTAQVYTPVAGSSLFYDSLKEGRIRVFDFSKHDFFNAVMPTNYVPVEKVQAWGEAVNLKLAFKPSRIRKYIKKEYDRRIANLFFNIIREKLIAGLRSLMAPPDEFEKWKKTLLERQLEIMRRDPMWDKCLRVAEEKGTEP